MFVKVGAILRVAVVCAEGDQRYVPPGALTDVANDAVVPLQIVVDDGNVSVGMAFTVTADVAVDDGHPGAETVTVNEVDELGLIEMLEVVAPFDHK